MIEYLLLGIVQGITEWLPVSSSGHLVIFEQLFKIKVDLFFNEKKATFQSMDKSQYGGVEKEFSDF